MTSKPNQQNQQLDLNQTIAQRKAKLDELKQYSSNPYINKVSRNKLANELQQEFANFDKEDLLEHKKEYTVAGRIMMRRIMGKASFVSLQDMSGRIQLYVTRDSLPESFYNNQFKKWDIGDIIWAKGTLFKTNTKELSIDVKEIKLVTKSLLPLPDKFHGLADVETRYRQRYLDLIVNEETRQVFLLRNKIICYIRNFFTEKGFLEVETPMMQPIAGGATAKPFITKHNALDMDLYLRIAPELYLKRLVIGGFEKVFEINRSFRNEGLSTRHNPEFTMIEFYEAFVDYKAMISYTEELIRSLTETVLGKKIINYQGNTINFDNKFKQLTMKESIASYNSNISSSDLENIDKLKQIAKNLKIKLSDDVSIGKIQTEIFEATVEHKLINPTFITQYPIEVSPLARANDDDSNLADRFEFFVAGKEIANGFSELNDPETQADRFSKQVVAKKAGNEEAMFFDKDFINALKYGMPPTAGEGIGIDRLVMLLTNSPSIKDVILFPHLKLKE